MTSTIDGLLIPRHLHKISAHHCKIRQILFSDSKFEIPVNKILSIKKIASYLQIYSKFVNTILTVSSQAKKSTLADVRYQISPSKDRSRCETDESEFVSQKIRISSRDRSIQPRPRTHTERLCKHLPHHQAIPRSRWPTGHTHTVPFLVVSKHNSWKEFREK